MTRPLAAVENAGLSRRQAARRFGVGVGASTMVKWPGAIGKAEASRRVGSVDTRPRGSPARTGFGWSRAAARATSPCAGGWPNWPSAGSTSTADRSGPSSTRRGSCMRARWISRRGRTNPARLVFMPVPGPAKPDPGDEAWAKTNMTPLRGRAPRSGSGFMSSAFSSRPCGLATSSSWPISAPTRARPCGRPSTPPARGSSSCRNTRPTRPIEQLFAKREHWLRKTGKRTVAALSDALGEILDTIRPEECRNYRANAGYDPA